jgi:hypothetical protein
MRDVAKEAAPRTVVASSSARKTVRPLQTFEVAISFSLRPRGQ